eukprot:3319763-Rhodomonas_salina.2
MVCLPPAAAKLIQIVSSCPDSHGVAWGYTQPSGILQKLVGCMLDNSNMEEDMVMVHWQPKTGAFSRWECRFKVQGLKVSERMLHANKRELVCSWQGHFQEDRKHGFGVCLVRSEEVRFEAWDRGERIYCFSPLRDTSFIVRLILIAFMLIPLADRLVARRWQAPVEVSLQRLRWHAARIKLNCSDPNGNITFTDRCYPKMPRASYLAWPRNWVVVSEGSVHVLTAGEIYCLTDTHQNQSGIQCPSRTSQPFRWPKDLSLLAH